MADHSLVKKSLLYIAIIIALTALDQFTKVAAVSHLMGSGPYVIIDNVLELLYVENRGAAFGMMKGMRPFFLLLAPAVSVGVFLILLGTPDEKKYLPVKICFLGIIAGAIGNFIDRLMQGYVVDFIYFKPIDFPVFNVADICVTCSCILLMILFIFYYSEDDLKRIQLPWKRPRD